MLLLTPDATVAAVAAATAAAAAAETVAAAAAAALHSRAYVTQTASKRQQVKP